MTKCGEDVVGVVRDYYIRRGETRMVVTVGVVGMNISLCPNPGERVVVMTETEYERLKGSANGVERIANADYDATGDWHGDYK